MEFLGIQITRETIEQWLVHARDYALPLSLQSIGQIVLGVVVFVVARWAIGRLQHKVAARTKTKVDDHLFEAARRMTQMSVVAWVIWRIAWIWELQSLASFVVAGWIVVLSLPIAELLSKLIRVVEEVVAPKTQSNFDDTALPLVNKVMYALTIAGSVLLALAYLGINIIPFVAGASVLGVAIGFAAQDTLSNLIAGVLLIVDRPFNVGDRIELWTTPTDTATWGDVIEIGLRATKIRNPDNLVFVIPNNQIMQRDIVNYTASGDNIRLRIPIAIAYDADPDKAKEIIHRVALEVDGVMHDPAPKIIIRNFGESAVDLQLRVWIADARQRRRVADEITERVKRSFDQAGVEIPYAKRDLYIRSMPEVLQGSSPMQIAPGGQASGNRDVAAPSTKGDSDD